MRIALVNLTSGGFSGGYRKYLQRLLPLLSRHPDVSRLDVFLPPGQPPANPLEGVGYESWPARDGWRRFPALRHRLAELRPDVIFVPTARYIGSPGIPTVVMVRNMEPLERPLEGNSFGEALRNLVRARAARNACRKATRVIAVSRHVERVISTKWNLPTDKVGVVYHGIDAPAPRDSATVTRPTAVPAALAGSMLFTAGSIRPARGLEDLVGALGAQRREGPVAPLVIAGQVDAAGRRYQQHIIQLANSLGVAESIHWAGHLSAAEMSWCFYNARAFVMTSRSEACPNIVLEALVHAATCVSTDTPPMPEFFQNAALYYRAGDAASLATSLRKMDALTPTERDARRAEAARRASDFKWETTAQRTIEELRAAMR
jgi:glycosyltransferase involved in cell wall biosynthesis